MTALSRSLGPSMTLKWVEGTQLLTDPLTKLAGEGDLLRAALRSGEHATLEEAKTLGRRLEERQRRAETRREAPAMAAALTGPPLIGHGPPPDDLEDLPWPLQAASEDEADDEDYEPTYARKLRLAVLQPPVPTREGRTGVIARALRAAA